MVDDSRLAALRAAVTAAPNEPALHLLLADALLERGLFDEAALEYRSAVRLRADSADGLYGLAVSLARQNKVRDAWQTLDELERAHGESAKAQMLRARVAFQGGDTPRAVSAYRRAISLDPNLSDPHFDTMLGLSSEPESDRDTDAGRIRQNVDEPDDPMTPELEKPDVTFADVGGMDSVKEEIRRRIIGPMTHPDLYKAYGQKAGGGLLLYGPPGCGKTFLARATAGEVKAAFFSIGIHQILDSYLGQSEKNMHAAFELARVHSPSVLFFDEVDALASNRGDLRRSWSRLVINQFLAEFDGMNGANDGVLVVGATNAPWQVDSAFRRPGRFDQTLFVPPPDEAARTAILKVHLRDRPTRNLDYAKIAQRTNGFSGADLEGIVQTAVAGRLDEAMRSGQLQPVETNDLLTAAGRTKPTTGEWFASARNYALYANEAGLYDPVKPYLKM